MLNACLLQQRNVCARILIHASPFEQDLQAALELQSVQNSQLSVSLEHEQMINDNLRKELQIEHSRCEALVSQEQKKVSELQRNLEAEKNRSLELLNSLNHERVLTEQLSMRAKEDASCQHRASLLEQAFIRELQAKLEEERSRTTELAAILDKTHQKAVHSKRQLEAEVRMRCKETQKEREVSNKLQATVKSLQSQKQEVIHSIETQKEQEGKLKADEEQLQLVFETMQEQHNNKKEEKEQRQQTEMEKETDRQRDQERLVIMFIRVFSYSTIAINREPVNSILQLKYLKQIALKKIIRQLFFCFFHPSCFQFHPSCFSAHSFSLEVEGGFVDSLETCQSESGSFGEDA